MKKMKRLTMIDGNNLLFRSYYATAYTGNFMKNSKILYIVKKFKKKSYTLY